MIPYKNYTAVFVFCLGFNVSAAFAAADEHFEALYNQALTHFKATQYTEAESLFSQSIGYKARMGQAVSAYRLKQINKAASLFMQSILLADSDEQRYIALYNSATCRFIKGDYPSALQLFKDAKKYKLNDKNAAQFIELSAYLGRLVLAEIARKNARTHKKKSSEGKKTVSAIDFVFDDDINLRLEDNESTDSKNKNIGQLFSSDRELLTKLVAVGIDAVELNNTTSTVKSLSYIDLNIIDEFTALEHVTFTPSASISDLWKRIFELEQGYPASLEQAETLPGVRPW